MADYSVKELGASIIYRLHAQCALHSVSRNAVKSSPALRLVFARAHAVEL